MTSLLLFIFKNWLENTNETCNLRHCIIKSIGRSESKNGLPSVVVPFHFDELIANDSKIDFLHTFV